MKTILLLVSAWMVAASAAIAQVNYTPQAGVTTGYYAKTTYSSSFFGLVPVSGATDVVCIAGSASKTVTLQRIRINGTVAVAAVAFPVNLVRRAVVNSSGIAATTTANPGTSTSIASRNTSRTGNNTATATLISYVANPTINDSAPVYIDSLILSLNLTSAGGAPGQVDFYFGRDNMNNIQAPVLRGTGQQICVNFAGVALVNAAALNGSITWTEE